MTTRAVAKEKFGEQVVSGISCKYCRLPTSIQMAENMNNLPDRKPNQKWLKIAFTFGVRPLADSRSLRPLPFHVRRNARSEALIMSTCPQPSLTGCAWNNDTYVTPTHAHDVKMSQPVRGDLTTR